MFLLESEMESKSYGIAKNEKVCTFFGHADGPTNIKKEIQKVIEDLILQKGVNTFYVGTNGNFDQMVQSVLIDLKNQYPNLESYIVLAYIPGIKPEFDTGYEKLETLYPDGLEKSSKAFCNRSA